MIWTLNELERKCLNKPSIGIIIGEQTNSRLFFKIVIHYHMFEKHLNKKFWIIE
jgi:hypothetical protein